MCNLGITVQANDCTCNPPFLQVPGDIVLLKSGDKIPADMRLIEATNLQVQEAMLTGESVPVSKHLKPAPPEASLGDRRCMAYSATSVVSGQGKAIVVGTGDSAEIGQINKMVNTVGGCVSGAIREVASSRYTRTAFI